MGSNIFRPSDQVKDFITGKLNELEQVDFEDAEQSITRRILAILVR